MIAQCRLAALFAGALLCAGCKQEMAAQPKSVANGVSAAFPNGIANRPLPAGTIAQGDGARTAALTTPPAVTDALLSRGRERFDIFCSPCHGGAGDGRGIIVQRGFPQPPNFHSDAFLASPAARFVNAITNGHGVMYSYAARVAPQDRWAIAAYIRALQLSQSATLAASLKAPEPAQ